MVEARDARRLLQLTPERWARIEELYQAALARPEDERAAFLGVSCRGDEGLQREVESLLVESEPGDRFLEEPALVWPAQLAGDGVPEGMTGRSLGGYELHELLGSGGMGDVYRARDTTLGRDVAIKILPPAFTRDPDRLARFEREARMLAALNHINICAIYGLEEADGIRFLVLELIEGMTLAQSLRPDAGRSPRGPGLSPNSAAMIAVQIADALEAAHERGIVHRDLKPANIMTTPAGVVKVLDFGLAKAVAGDGSTPDGFGGGAAGATRAGAVMGTAAYMSPEQTRGLPVDKRTDIWAFGCVFYEMLTGRLAFGGDTASDSIARILEHEPDWSALPATTPASLRRLLARCLAKDPGERWHDIADVRIELNDAMSAPPSAEPPSGPGRDWRRAARWSVTAVGAVAAITWLGTLAPWRSASPPSVLRLDVALGVDAALLTRGGAAAILSPDGQTMAFVARPAGAVPQLYVRRLDQLRATPVPGTEGASSPFFSPDGQWIAFFDADNSTLKKVAVTGGAVATLSDGRGQAGGGGTWMEDGTIVFSPNFLGPLARVSSDGGPADIFTAPRDGEVTQRWPQVLPGGRQVLYTASDAANAVANANLVVQSVPDGAHKIVQKGASYGRYLPSGHLVFMQGGSLFAAPFDPVRLELTGPAVRVIDGVVADHSGSGTGVGGAQFAWASTGTLVYLPGQIVEAVEASLVSMDRSGSTGALYDPPPGWSHPSYSPDGNRIAMDVIERGNIDVWVYNASRGDLARLTTHPGDDVEPTWTPDGQRLVFVSTRNDSTANLYWQRADGTGDVQPLTRSRNSQYGGSSWHPHGRLLAFTEVHPQSGKDLMVLPIEGNEATGWTPGTASAFLRTPANEQTPVFSPDGRWLAYVSNESGRYEVYVQPFPGPGERSKISNAGSLPYSKVSWSRTRQELLFGAADEHIWVVPFAVEDGVFRADKPRRWSDRPFLALPRGGTLDMHPGGERVAMGAGPAALASPDPDRLVFVFNFFDELRRLAPVTR